MAASAEREVPRVCLVGTRGYGAQHLERLRRLQARGRVRLTSAVDALHSTLDGGPDVPVYRTMAELAERGEPVDVVVVATPIVTHAALAAAALDLGADLLLEKPPTATMEQFHALLRQADSARRLVQVGFQSLGSGAIAGVQQLLADGTIGELRAVSATGLWMRRREYYTRSSWSGRRVLDGQPVVDGVTTNPLSHAVATALRLAGARTEDDVAQVDLELFHANAIESDDTSVVRLTTSHGVPITCTLTLCAPEQQDPWVTVEGTQGSARLYYTRDELVVTTADGSSTTRTFDRVDLMDDLLDRRADGRALMSPLHETGAFMTVLEAVRTAPDPAPIPDAYVDWVGEGAEAHAVVRDVEQTFARVAKSQSSLAALDVPWAGPVPPADAPDVLRLGDVEVARSRLGVHVAPTSSPRPVLHPVRTLGGTVVTDYQPFDHPWHLGVGVAVQDVDGVNCWGGRTYTRSDGRYVWRRDHGRVRRESSSLRSVDGAAGGCLQEHLVWSGPDGGDVLHENRTWAWRPLPAGSPVPGWVLELDFTLTPPGETPVVLGSPGSNGRPGGGYGGFFWRLPPVDDVQVLTADAEGEDAVHGRVAPWLAVSGRFASGEASLVLAADDADPWFVRCASYPGLGRSLAWDQPVTVSPERPLRRRIGAAVVDGRVDRTTAACLAQLLHR